MRAGCLVAAVAGSDSRRPRRGDVRAARDAAAALKVDRFDRDRAFADLRHQVELGPRPAGSPRRAQLARWLRDRLPHGRIESVPGGYENVVGRSPAAASRSSLAAHYDTKDLPGFVGANDGAGGTAAVLEIARALRRAKRPAGAPPIRFVLFDGEESPDDNEDFYSTGPARLAAVRAPPRRRDPRADPARLRRREGRDADPARGELAPRAVGAPARRGAQGRGAGARSRTRCRARSPTTTRRSSAAACRRST